MAQLSPSVVRPRKKESSTVWFSLEYEQVSQESSLERKLVSLIDAVKNACGSPSLRIGFRGWG